MFTCVIMCASFSPHHPCHCYHATTPLSYHHTTIHVVLSAPSWRVYQCYLIPLYTHTSICMSPATPYLASLLIVSCIDKHATHFTHRHETIIGCEFLVQGVMLLLKIFSCRSCCHAPIHVTLFCQHCRRIQRLCCDGWWWWW